MLISERELKNLGNQVPEEYIFGPKGFFMSCDKELTDTQVTKINQFLIESEKKVKDRDFTNKQQKHKKKEHSSLWWPNNKKKKKKEKEDAFSGKSTMQEKQFDMLNEKLDTIIGLLSKLVEKNEKK
jgi:hypothetical protein